MSRFLEYVLAGRYRWNGFLLKFYLYLLGCKSGKNLRCLSFPVFRDIPKGNIVLGDSVVLGRKVIFELTKTGALHLGNHTVIGDNVRLSSAAKIWMGDYSGIAENSSIRGSFHQLMKSENYMRQPSIADDIYIGRDVLIGANSQILLGADLPDGVVIGALSLVTRKEKLHPYSIFAGSPARHIGDRQ